MSDTMLNPVALSLSPSCHDAISWSPDGELAIAAGEYFQILVCIQLSDEFGYI